VVHRIFSDTLHVCQTVYRQRIGAVSGHAKAGTAFTRVHQAWNHAAGSISTALQSLELHHGRAWRDQRHS
jgi:hypothetical protein